jgi:hypothetical protein
MGGTLQIDAQLTAIPACGDGSFPSGITNLPFDLNPSCKSYNVTTGAQVANVNSTGSYAPLGSIGAGGAVTNATTLYLRTTTPVAVQLTLSNDGSGTTIADLQVSGVLLYEAPAGYEVQGVGVKGVATVEYLAAGAS